MIDAKQPIYDAMNGMGRIVPAQPLDDNQLILDVYENLGKIEDRDLRNQVTELAKALRARNAWLNKIRVAWDTASTHLRTSCASLTAIAEAKNSRS